MVCPLCKQPIRDHGPTMYSIWMEMESEQEAPVVIHVSCAWDLVRDELYRRDQSGEMPERWIGWEPMDQVSPYTGHIRDPLPF